MTYQVPATFGGFDITTLEVVLACDGSDEHPFTGATLACPEGLGAGDVLLVLELPFGSFAPDQPAATVQLELALSELADLEVPLPVYAGAGFRFGADASDNPDVDPPIVQDPLVRSDVTPEVVRLSKTYLGPEDETVTGPNFERTWRIELTAAAGQSLTDVTITDALPDNVEVVAVRPTVADDPGAVTVVQPETTPASDAEVAVTFPTVTGAGGVSAAFEIDFFVPLEDANGAVVLAPATGAPTTSVNEAGVTGTWEPVDPRDDTVVDAVLATPASHTLTDRSLAIQKTVEVVSDVGAAGPTPGDVLEWTLEFQVSDYFAFDDVIVADVLTDGQSIDDSFTPVLDLQDAAGSVSGFDLSTYRAAPVDPAPACVDSGNIRSNIDLSAAVAAALAGSEGRLTGGLVAEPDSGPTTGTITYRTIIDPTYRCLDEGNAVDALDTLGNDVEITGMVVDGDGVTTEAIVTDGSSASVTITGPGLTKSIYARNRDTGDVRPQFAAGDTITFRLTTTLPLTNFQDLSLTDFLPRPVLAATEITQETVSGTPDPTPPGPGVISLGPDHSATLLPDPSVSVDATNNSVTIAFPDVQDDVPPEPATIDLLLTLTVSDEPFADGLFLTNVGSLTFANSFGTVESLDAVAGFELTNPQPAISKGVVTTDGDGTLAPAKPRCWRDVVARRRPTTLRRHDHLRGARVHPTGQRPVRRTGG